MSIKSKEISEIILYGMLEHIEELNYEALVPSIYQVYLRPDDYKRLQGIFSNIINDVKKKMDEELEKLSQPSFIERMRGKKPFPHKKAQGDWYISFYEGSEDEIPPGDLDLYVELVSLSGPDLGLEGTTVRIKRKENGQTVNLGRTEKPTKDTHLSPPVLPSQPIKALGASPYAELTFQTFDGNKSYQMTKEQIVVGRGGINSWVDLKLDTNKIQLAEQISREHLRIKYDPISNKFYIKDLSALGTKVDGKIIPKSLSEDKRDKNIEIEIPSYCEIELADAVKIKFTANRK